MQTNIRRLPEDVDGDAYYWSSVDPNKDQGYADKLRAMSAAIHAKKGLWFAPAAPGFDARKIGGTRVIERKGGETFRKELATAASSSPDVIALISWNEFTENSAIEPTVNYGDQALQVLSSQNRTGQPASKSGIGRVSAYPGIDFDSSWPGMTRFRLGNLILLGGLGALFAASLGVIIYRGRRRDRTGPGSKDLQKGA